MLFAFTETDWTDWEADFLDSISGQDKELSTRQAEKLVELRNNAIRPGRI